MRGAESPGMERHALSAFALACPWQGECFLTFPRLGSSQGSCSYWGESELLQESRGREFVGLLLLPGLEPLTEPGLPGWEQRAPEARVEVKECHFAHGRKSSEASRGSLSPGTEPLHSQVRGTPRAGGCSLSPWPWNPFSMFLRQALHFPLLILASQIVSPCTPRGAS